jgi:deazaflavin-dependent oxidoreductase (nitroreductase family)
LRRDAVKIDDPKNPYMERLNRVASKQTVRLTHYGRKSGKPYEVTIAFAVDGDRVYIGTQNVNRQWVRNVQKTPKVGLSIAGEKFEGQARFLTVRAEHERAQRLMRRKYWMYWPILALARALIAIGLLPDRIGSFEVTLNG